MYLKSKLCFHYLVLFLFMIYSFASAKLMNAVFDPKRALSDEMNNYIKSESYTVGIFDKKFGSICTGVIVSEKLILTAAHCIENKDVKNNLEVRFGNDLNGIYEPIGIDSFYLSGDFKGSKNSKQMGTNTGDLAIILLKNSIPKKYNQIDIYPDSRNLETQTPIIFAGFGLDKNVGLRSAGKLRRGLVYLTQPHYSDTEFYIEAANGNGACKGDSGGPAFILKDKKLVLAGIVSRGSKDCNFSVYTNSNKILGFYNQVLTEIQKNLHSNS